MPLYDYPIYNQSDEAEANATHGSVDHRFWIESRP